jgi:hypothetical protein
VIGGGESFRDDLGQERLADLDGGATDALSTAPLHPSASSCRTSGVTIEPVETGPVGKSAVLLALVANVRVEGT